MSLWYTRCSNYPTESSAHDGMPFVTWLVVRVDVALGLNTFFFFFLCMCFPYSKKKRKKSEAFFFFFPAQAITALLGSSRLLPWQLPVNIPAEFFLSAEERAPLFSATDKSIGHSWRKCKRRREGGEEGAAIPAHVGGDGSKWPDWPWRVPAERPRLRAREDYCRSKCRSVFVVTL